MKMPSGPRLRVILRMAQNMEKAKTLTKKSKLRVFRDEEQETKREESW